MRNLRKTTRFSRSGHRAVQALLLPVLALVSICACSPGTVRPEPDEFYAGQTIRLIVPFSPGGGYDLHARLLADRIGGYIPGEPTVVVENMPGAGGLIAARYFTQRAKSDGLTLGMFSSGIVLHELVGHKGIKPLDVGLEEFVFVGSPSPDVNVCFFSVHSGYTDYSSWAHAVPGPTIGMSGPSSGGYVATLIVAHALALPMRPVVGYGGTTNIKQALDNGEVDGACATQSSFETVFGGRENYSIAVQGGLEPVPELSDVPLALDLANSDRSRELLRTLAYMREIGRFYALPPGTAPDLTALLRHAFMETMNDDEFLRMAETTKLPIDPMDGDEVTKRITTLLGLPETTRKDLGTILDSGAS